MELTATFMVLLEGFAPVFTAPSFQTFQLLMTGWIMSVRHRYVTDLIVSSDSVGNGHFSDYHRFFSQAAWNIDKLWERLARLVVSVLCGSDGKILLAADDTLCRKRGLTLFGVGMHHDPLISSRAMKLVSWGHDWVILSIVVVNPWWAPTKVFALPICARLYRNRQGLTKGQKKDQQQSRASKQTQTKKSSKKRKQTPKKAKRTTSQQKGKTKKAKETGHRTRPELLREMLALVASWFPGCKFLLVVDSLYSGESVLRYLPENMDLIGPVHPKAALYAPAPKPAKRGRGGPRKKGQRLSSRDAWAADRTAWEEIRFDQFGLHATLEVKTRTGLYYKAGKDRLLRFVLSRDTSGDRPTHIYYCTNLEWEAKEILSYFSHRWASEVLHFDAKQYLGLEDPANRKPLAVERTAPMALFLYSLTVVWYAKHGHRHLKFPNRTWYTRKKEPSFADMLTTLRRVTWEDEFSRLPRKSTLWKKTLTLLTYLATLAG
jgi:hypothetical protein